MDCLRQICPQTSQTLFELCVEQFHSFERQGPSYKQCAVQKKDYKTCQDNTNPVEDGTIQVKLPNNLTKISQENLQALRHYIFPKTDLYGKPITCERLLKESQENPASLMEFKWGRLFPSRNAKAPFDTPIDRFGTQLPLLFQKVPIGNQYVLFIQAFCLSSEPRTKATPATFWQCKENIRIQENTVLPIELPIKEGACFN
ncbi:MAG: hypothetical protein AAGJ35_13440, partial [Myxococcota bacterium]